MPIYEYYCPVCQAKFEHFRSMSRRDEPIACPEGHEGGYRVVALCASFTKDEFGNVNTAGRIPFDMTEYAAQVGAT